MMQTRSGSMAALLRASASGVETKMTESRSEAHDEGKEVCSRVSDLNPVAEPPSPRLPRTGGHVQGKTRARKPKARGATVRSSTTSKKNPKQRGKATPRALTRKTTAPVLKKIIVPYGLPRDFLFGKGRQYDFHPGNVEFRVFLEKHVEHYASLLGRKEKTKFSLFLLDTYIAKTNAQFLEADAQEATRDKMRLKVTQVLRYIIRKRKNEDPKNQDKKAGRKAVKVTPAEAEKEGDTDMNVVMPAEVSEGEDSSMDLSKGSTSGSSESSSIFDVDETSFGPHDGAGGNRSSDGRSSIFTEFVMLRYPEVPIDGADLEDDIVSHASTGTDALQFSNLEEMFPFSAKRSSPV